MNGKLLSLVLAAGAAIAGCAGTARYEVDAYDAPPAPREEVVTYRPGYVWIHGSWNRYGDRWAWRDGYYVRERQGYVYQDGNWRRSGNHYVWVQGQWRARGAVAMRHRRRY